jgi:hypothetical protein
MNRRLFIKSASATGLLHAMPDFFGGNSVFASTQPADENHFFVFIRVPSGWDVTLSLDPQVHKNSSSQTDMFIEYRPEDIIVKDNLRFGPALKPLAPHMKDVAIINGILMNTADNGHDASLLYISTGDGAGNAPSLPVEIANSTDCGPLGVVFSGNVQTLDRKIMVTTVDSVLNIKDFVRLQSLEGFFKNVNRDSDLSGSLKSLINNSHITDRLTKNLSERENKFEQSSDMNLRDGHIIASAFLSGASNSAQIDIFADLDSHSNHEGEHLNTQLQAWQTISDIFNIFKSTEYGNSGETLFSRTTFAVVSEFSRTPALNSSKGKDHNPLTNSVLLAGRNIVGGKSIGASHLITRAQSRLGQPQHVALPIDYSTGELALTKKKAEAPNFRFITPDRVVATIATAIGVDRNKFKSTSLEGPVLQRVIKPS